MNVKIYIDTHKELSLELAATVAQMVDLRILRASGKAMKVSCGSSKQAGGG